MIYNITNKNFNEEVLKSEKYVLVDFNAPICVSCERISPYLAYASSNNKLVINSLKTDMSTKKLFTIDKAMSKIGTVLADKQHIYVVWGTKSGKNSNETAIKVCKYNADGKEVGSVSYTRKEIDTVSHLKAGIVTLL